ncbi:hypothetical protein CCB80_09780 [Armatimonadetes bacterium Uphvl-Ar1]|nr:hypothetical protein CCB80_09780 [Armatimonadetes bacterium Uphvl-Ar1]
MVLIIGTDPVLNPRPKHQNFSHLFSIVFPAEAGIQSKKQRPGAPLKKDSQTHPHNQNFPLQYPRRDKAIGHQTGGSSM